MTGKLKPFTVGHFEAWARKLVLDSGEHFQPEPFQLAFVADLFAGARENWLVVPEGNGKTTLLASIALYHCAFTPDAMVPIGSASRDQCEVLHNQAAGFVRRTPGLSKDFRIYDGYRRIKKRADSGRIQVYAADDRTGDGVIPTLALLDELHRHRDLRLYRIWAGKIDKRGGQIVAISTAGTPGSEFEEIRSLHRTQAETIEREGAHVRALGAGMALHDWAVYPEDADVENMDTVKAANPLSTITPASLARKWESPTMSIAHWKRFVCDIATRVDGEGISAEEWDALLEVELAPEPDTYRLGFIDIGRKIDTTAMGVLVWESAERRPIVGIKILEPPVGDAEIVDGLLELQRRFKPKGWVYDPNTGGWQLAQQLEAGENPRQGDTEFVFIEHAQSNAPMALAATRIDEAIRGGWLRHDGNKKARNHVLNAVRRSLGTDGRYRYDRPPGDTHEGKNPIDFLTGLMMANSVAAAEHAEPPKREPLVGMVGR